MEAALISPAAASIGGFPLIVFSVVIPLAGICVFLYFLTKRIVPLFYASPDPRLGNISFRLYNMFKFAVLQYRHPRYLFAGILHILIFAGFLVISVHSVSLVFAGIIDGFVLPGLGGMKGHVYGVMKAVSSTLVFIACVIAMIRRGIFKPKRYAVPLKYGKDHTGEAVFVLLLISGLMIADALYEGSLSVAQAQKGLDAGVMVPGTLDWIATVLLADSSIVQLQNIHLGFYFFHELIFFFFLCFLPFGKHFHVITSIPNVFFMKPEKGTIKPVKWGVDKEHIESLESFGVKKFEDFTWKHLLDFYTCADCGRCSDNCPANAAGRPLSPRFVSLKCRDYSYLKYPLWGQSHNGRKLVGDLLEEDEIWSCTTCGACEEECPLFIEYIDKIVDLRRGMVDDGLVPQSLQKPLRSLEKRGNPYGKMERKRGEWIKDLGENVFFRNLSRKETARTLYFVDSISSYDDRLQDVARCTAKLLNAAEMDFGILGELEMDSGHEVRRFGEEMLFMDLMQKNTSAIIDSGVKNIVTSDPHAFNSLKNDYRDLPPVKHISQVIAESIDSGKIRLKGLEDPSLVYTYHDPCYLGRHNGIYDIPRKVIDAVPGMKRIEMEKCRDRSFCCGGGGLMLFYEPVEETRIGKLRVAMAEKAGADVIITACPFCMVNIEDAIKTSGLEGKMKVMDITELIAEQMVPEKQAMFQMSKEV